MFDLLAQPSRTHRDASLAVLVAVLMTCVPVAEATAQVQLDRFYPPAVSVGGEATIKGEGKFPVWPLDVVCDREEIKVIPSEESGSFRIVVPNNAAPGVAWIRLHDPASASSLVPLLIEPQQPVTETEPNNSLEEAGKVDLPGVFVGRLEKSGDVDTLRISVRSGQTLVVSAVAHRVLRSPMDAVLQLLDQSGHVIVQVDDVRGMDPQIVHHVQQDGELLVRLFAFPETPNSTIGYAGAASHVYLLRLTSDAFVDHVLPLVVSGDNPAAQPRGWNLPEKADVERSPPTAVSPSIAYVPGTLGWQCQLRGPADSIHQFESREENKTATAPTLPFIFSGHIEHPAEVDRIQFEVLKGKSYRASVHSRKFGFTLDSVLRLVNPRDGSELGRNDDRERNQYDAALDYTAKEDGLVELQISDLVDAHGPRHAYSIVVEERKAGVKLSLAADHFAVKAGATVEIPIAIERQNGFNEKLQIIVEGLPAGVQAEPVDSEAKGATAKSVTLKLTADKGVQSQGTFRVNGYRVDAEGRPTGDPFTAIHSLRETIAIEDIWLTVAEK